ncbi:hypothetical protein pdam_00001217 [Pocillopora damicornis]|uniref:Uncharacterized protein n=1 Tax=Pocillopora damicornis TaxID=46731 RepID=A0A3M6TKU5_POCDA|nr:hypothetical protein pdam_00001217 [Pocillopora damicornis]
MLGVNWSLKIAASGNQQNVQAISCTKMSCKCFLFFLIISHVKVAHPSKDQNASIDGCVRFNWIEDFFARQRQSEWNYTVKDILQDCLSDYSKVNETTGCNSPIVNVTFPLFSSPSNFTLLEAEFFPLVAIKEESFSIGRQILHAFKQIWELIVICITGAMLSGIIIWFLVGWKSSSLTKSIVAIDEILDSYSDRYAKPFEQISAIEIYRISIVFKPANPRIHRQGRHRHSSVLLNIPRSCNIANILQGFRFLLPPQNPL